MPARTVTENETIVEGSQDQTRRNFLGKIWAGLGGLAVLEICVLLFTYMKPRLKEGDFGNVITVGPAAVFPPGSVTPVPTGRFYLRFGDWSATQDIVVNMGLAPAVPLSTEADPEILSALKEVEGGDI